LGHPQLRAWDLAIRAEIAFAQGRFADAVTSGAAALRLAVAVGEPVSAMGAFHPLVGALAATGQREAARAVVAEHREFFATHPGWAVAEAVLLAEAQVGERDADGCGRRDGHRRDSAARGPRRPTSWPGISWPRATRPGRGRRRPRRSTP
jgi:hypothetical protein